MKYTFEQLLSSVDLRYKAPMFEPTCGPYVMDYRGNLTLLDIDITGKPVPRKVIWEGYIQEAPPPPKPFVMKKVEYRNVYTSGFSSEPCSSRTDADILHKTITEKYNWDNCVKYPARIACIRIELEVTEGQWDD